MEEINHLIARLDVESQRLAYLPIANRLRKYTDQVNKRDGTKFRVWKELPKADLEKLLSKILEEIETYELVPRS